jgi:hypothetical protein
MHASPTKTTKERPQIHHNKIDKKRLRKLPKKQNGRDSKGFEEPRRVIYTYHEGSYKV